MSIMLEEIYQQPDAVRNVLERESSNWARLAEELRSKDIQHVLIAARGTSDNAATYAKYLIEIVCGIPVTLAAPSVFTLYGASLKLHRTLAIGISQSGQGTDVVQTLASARQSGALTACITNVEGSPLTQVSDHVFLCHAGVERAVAATKTYTTSLANVALLAAHWADHALLKQEIARLPQLIQEATGEDRAITAAVERYRYIQECAVLARGLNQCTALEAALKMTETSYLVAKPYSGADFLHGPVAMVTNGFPVFMYMPDGSTYSMLLDLARRLKDQGTELIIVANNPEALQLARTPVRIPSSVHELVSPIVAIVPGQMLACHLAVSRGADPDSPRGLSKVTLTR